VLFYVIKCILIELAYIFQEIEDGSLRLRRHSVVSLHGLSLVDLDAVGTWWEALKA
jgi:hypothetical protein